MQLKNSKEVKLQLILCSTMFTFFGIGRGGEVKFLNYKSWMFCETYNILFVQWFQRKNLVTNPAGFAPDFEFAETCVVLLLGCFWACESGLERVDGIGEPFTPRSRKVRYVFQDFHNIQDRNVTAQISRIIKPVRPDQIKPMISAKSCRIGAMTDLSWDPAVTYEEAVALGGWSTPSNRDWYVWTYLVAIVPAVLSLAGCPDPRSIPVLPNVGKLFYEGSGDDLLTVGRIGEDFLVTGHRGIENHFAGRRPVSADRPAVEQRSILQG